MFLVCVLQRHMSNITWEKVDKFEQHGSPEKQVSSGKLEGAIYFETLFW